VSVLLASFGLLPLVLGAGVTSVFWAVPAAVPASLPVERGDGWAWLLSLLATGGWGVFSAMALVRAASGAPRGPDVIVPGMAAAALPAS